MSEYRINGTSKWGMLILALMFDGIQFITPAIMDKLIIAVSALVLGMMFIERGALKSSSGGALWFFRIVVPFAEVFISIVPGITLVTWIQIKMSRIADKRLPEGVHAALAQKQRLSFSKKRAAYKKTIGYETKQIYGKGRRGARTLAKKTQLQAKMAGRTTEQKQRALGTAKNYSKSIKKSG